MKILNTNYKNGGRKMKIIKTKNTIKNYVSTLVLGSGLFLGRVFAQPQEISNIINLLQDLLTWVLVIVPVAGGLMIGYHSLMKIMADGDPGEIADRNSKIKMVLTSAVIAFIGAGIVRIVVSYF